MARTATRKKVSSDEELFPSLAGQGIICVDCETCDQEMKTRGSGAHRDGFIAGVAVGTEAGFRQYYPVAHEPGGNLPKDKVFGWLKEQMRLPVPKLGSNILYDLGFMHYAGVDPVGPFYDITVAEPLLDENRFQYGLDHLAKDYVGRGKNDEQLDRILIERFGRKNPKGNIWRLHPDETRPYALEDVALPLEVFAKQKPLLERDGLWNLFMLETKLIPMLAAMRQRGVRVDLKRAEQMREVLKRQFAELSSRISREAGGIDVQIWAADSIAKAFDYLGLSYPLTPKTKKASFTATFLEHHPHPICDLIREARKLDKLIGTFIEGSILEKHHEGRIYCNFNQLRSDSGGAVSGRFSSSQPNLQFIPIRTEEGKQIRKMFLPDEGCQWYKHDYSQIEYVLIIHDAYTMKLRGAAEVAKKYTEDEDADFHQIVAEMTGLKRSAAKTVNFGLAYGEGIDKLCRSLGLDRAEGERLIAQYHKRAPFLKPLAQGCSQQVARTGEMRTILNRRRQFNAWEITKWNKETKQREQVVLRHWVRGARRAFTHKALNARIQGSAADIMKKAMVDIWESGVCDVVGVPQLTVHDELDGSCPPTKRGKEAVREMARIMETTVELSVPLRVDWGIGPNWGEVE